MQCFQSVQWKETKTIKQFYKQKEELVIFITPSLFHFRSFASCEEFNTLNTASTATQISKC